MHSLNASVLLEDSRSFLFRTFSVDFASSFRINSSSFFVQRSLRWWYRRRLWPIYWHPWYVSKSLETSDSWLSQECQRNGRRKRTKSNMAFSKKDKAWKKNQIGNSCIIWYVYWRAELSLFHRSISLIIETIFFFSIFISLCRIRPFRRWLKQIANWTIRRRREPINRQTLLGFDFGIRG